MRHIDDLQRRFLGLKDPGSVSSATSDSAAAPPDNLRSDHLIASLELVMKHLGPSDARVPVQNVAKVVPVIDVR